MQLASSNYCQCPRQWKLKFSYIMNDCQVSLKFGARQENRNTPNFPDLSPTIPDSWQSLWFQVSFVRIIWDFPGMKTQVLLKENCSLTFNSESTFLFDVNLTFFNCILKSMKCILNVNK